MMLLSDHHWSEMSWEMRQEVATSRTQMPGKSQRQTFRRTSVRPVASMARRMAV